MANPEHDPGSGFEVTVKRSFDYPPGPGNEWDRLLEKSTFRSVFQTSDWLRACIDTYCEPGSLLVPELRRQGQLIAAVALRQRGGVVGFAGSERSDYGDFLVSQELDEQQANRAVETLLMSACDSATGFRHFMLGRIPMESQTASYMQSPRFRLYSHARRYAVAPHMAMDVAGEKVRKKSLRRHENVLKRQGSLECRTFTRAAEILPLLDEFFEQHIQRWRETPTPSLFLEEKNRLFYRRMIENFDATGCLRFTLLRLDGQMIAAHLGWLHDGRFYWYKPSFDINFREFSPGEVLLKNTIEQAMSENAEEFDFLMGDEAYKSRFATGARDLVSLEIDASWLPAFAKRLGRAVSRRIGKLGSDRDAD